ncbi:MAG: VanZ family protein [Planctomycetota bacterium]|jgi:VanZ family protein
MKLRWAIVILWAALVVGLSVLPGGSIEGPKVPFADKVAHFVMYCIMAALVHRAAGGDTLRRAVLVAVACGALGGMLEIVQEFVPGRGASIGDALANLLGAATASAAWLGLLRRKRASAAPE